MNKFEQHIAHNVERLNLLRRSTPVLTALSGGADSVALTAALVRLGYDVRAAHCNFHLRGDESDRDMRHAHSVASRLGIDIYTRHFDVATRQAATGESVEMACRSLRYDWFESLLDRDHAQAIAVGHHREDNVETMLLNLTRGTGIAGLTGMEWRRGSVVRPMLDLSRQDILDYLEEIGLGYVDDSSNAQDEYRRNRLRLDIIPALEAAIPGATEALHATMAHLADDRLLVNDAMCYWRDMVGSATENDPIHLVKLMSLTHSDTRHAAVVLFNLIKHQGFNAAQAQDIIEAAVAGRSGQQFRSTKGYILELDRGALSSINEESLCHRYETYQVSLARDILVPIHIEVSHHNIAEFRPERDASTIYLDASVLDTDDAPFTLRHPRTGDRLEPFGMEGSRLVSDILCEASLSSAQKRDTWLLARGNRVLWVVGHRASRHYPVAPSTRRYIRLHINATACK